MSSMQGPADPDPWRELQRRRVVRVAILYAAVAFAVVEVTILLVAAARAPEWAFRAVLGALVLAFPPSMVLAWRYDVTPAGIVRTPEGVAEEAPPVGSPWLWWVAVTGALGVGMVLEMLR